MIGQKMNSIKVNGAHADSGRVGNFEPINPQDIYLTDETLSAKSDLGCQFCKEPFEVNEILCAPNKTAFINNVMDDRIHYRCQK